MIDFAITTLILLIIVVGIFGMIIIGFLCASIYDAWYQRKYEAWLILQDDNKPPRPVAK